MPITSLPLELLGPILGYVPTEDQENTALVCRAWLTPSREAYWGSITLSLEGYVPEKLVDCLKSGSTSIPRHIYGIVIDESEEVGHRSEEEAREWQEGVVAIMAHFQTVSSMTIRYLDLTAFPPALQGKILRPGMVTATLVAGHIGAPNPSMLLPFLMGNPDLLFLGLGSFKFDTAEEEVIDARSGQGPNVVSHTQFSLNNLGHFVVFGRSLVTWSVLIPLVLRQSSLEHLKTLVLVSINQDITSKLIKRAAPSLHSLALDLTNEESVFDLFHITSLRNLSLDIASYAAYEPVLANMVQTVRSASSSLEYVFINTGPAVIDKDKQRESAPPLWASLDAHLSQCPNLKGIVMIQLLSGCLGMFAAMPGALGGAFDKWKQEVLDYAESKLPACKEKGLLRVSQTSGAWTSRAFADMDVLE
ncbi:hypothetical protein PG993_015178 [Apiospora rasikravindrae]|uniref:F-box domain-containing protein n=1 Tax=Apiospora rasikravindrae TaxID=990691 RepID=A0ABR1RPV1_9PEZI